MVHLLDRGFPHAVIRLRGDETVALSLLLGTGRKGKLSLERNWQAARLENPVSEQP